MIDTMQFASTAPELILGGGAITTGLLTASIAAGAFVSSVFSGPVGRVRHHGLGIERAIIAYGIAIAAFGAVLLAGAAGLAAPPRIDEDHANTVVLVAAIEPALISRLVDARYGGTGDIPANRAREFTATEESLLARLTEQLIEALSSVWSEIVPVKASLRARETNVAFAALVRPDEPVAVTRFTITPWPGKEAQVEIVYPVSALRSVEQELLRSHDDTPPPAGEWHDRLAAAVGEIRFPARTVLARPELSFSELMQLQVGDVIPVTLPSLVPLLVEGRKIAVGTIGEHDGRAALRVERIETRRSAS